MNRSINEVVNVEEIGIANICKTLMRMTAVRMVNTMVMRPAVNGESGTSDGFSGVGFCKKGEIVGTWLRTCW